MEKTFILGNNQHLKSLSKHFVEIPILNTNEEEKIHNWLIEIFKNNEIEKIVIEIGNNAVLSLQIAYHIRLSLEYLKKKSLVPILFVSSLSLNTIMIEVGIYSQIFATKGVFFCEFDLESIMAEIGHLTGLKESEYSAKFLEIIQIKPDEKVGRHSIANIWGAYIMDKVSNANALPAEAAFKKKLYFKYLSAFHYFELYLCTEFKILGSIPIGRPIKINSKNKRILLIDDESDKGWDLVLKKVLDTTNHEEDFVVIKEKVKDYESFSQEAKKIIETGDFDLYLVDLRLNGLDEENNVFSDNFSGMKVLEKLKSLNKGNQVIIFTASNKVWNLKVLLDKGADGYYLKESPEYIFSQKTSEQNYENFKKNVEMCLERSFYLKSSWRIINYLKDSLESTTDSEASYKDFAEELNKLFDLSFTMYNKSTTKNDFAYSYISLFKCLELITDKYVSQDNSIWNIGNQIPLKKYDWVKESNIYRPSEAQPKDWKPSIFDKITGLCFQLWNYNNQDVEQLYYSIKRRNEFIHPTKPDEVKSQSKKVKSECEKIYEASGYKILLEQLQTIINNLETQSNFSKD